MDDDPGLVIESLGGNCPVQAEGTVDGIPFYFRSRGDEWSFGVGDDPIGAPEWEHCEPYGIWPEAGWITEEQAMKFIAQAAALWRIRMKQPNGADPPTERPFQNRVDSWVMACFGIVVRHDKRERQHRFFEEAGELIQALGTTREEAHQLVDYVYDRTAGDPAQEVGGVLLTLAALCNASRVSMQQAGETELARVWTKIDQIRAKQAAKPSHGPLPGPSEPRANSNTEQEQTNE